MDYRFGEATPSEFEAVRRVWSVVYNRGEGWEQTEPAPGETWHVAESEGKIVWACATIQGKMSRAPWGIVVPCAKVALVGTVAEARGAGIANRAMCDLNRALRGAGYVAAALYPYREVFYAKSGYARCGWRWQFKAPRDRMPKLRAELKVREIAAEQIDLVAPCYDRMRAKLSGSFVRSRGAWTHRLGRKPEAIYVAEGAEGVEGYFWARPEGFWGWMNVGEFAWSTERGYRSCLATMRALAENQEGLSWCEPPESPFRARYLDQGIEASLSRGTMFRVLDVRAALEAVAGPSEPYSLDVVDPDITENCGPVRVAPGNPTQVTQADDGLRLGIADFTQAWMGSPSAVELEGQLGWAKTSLAGHLVPSQVCCMDFF